MTSVLVLRVRYSRQLRSQLRASQYVPLARRSGFCDQPTVKQYKDQTLNRDERRSQLRR